jgi:hypothetical protein
MGVERDTIHDFVCDQAIDNQPFGAKLAIAVHLFTEGIDAGDVKTCCLYGSGKIG